MAAPIRAGGGGPGVHADGVGVPERLEVDVEADVAPFADVQLDRAMAAMIAVTKGNGQSGRA
jgi:hypothetical protein